MREIVLSLISPETKKKLILSDEAASEGEKDPKERLEKELHRATLLLIVGLSPRWVIPQLEQRIEDVYQKDRNKILEKADFTFDVAALPEIQGIHAQDWAKLWTQGNLGRFLSYLPSLETYLRISAIIYREQVPERLRENYASTMKKYKAGLKNTLRQKLNNLRSSPNATIEEADQALHSQLILLHREVMAATRFYLEHRNEILGSVEEKP